MKRFLSLFGFVIFVFAVSIAKSAENNAKAELTQSEQSALRGLKFYNAFECSILASNAGDKSEQKRLYDLGIEEGRKFLKELEEGKIKQSDISATVPMVVMFSLGGPSHDFMLGRIFESAANSVYRQFKENGNDTDELRKMAAQAMLTERNSMLIGR